MKVFAAQLVAQPHGQISTAPTTALADPARCRCATPDGSTDTATATSDEDWHPVLIGRPEAWRRKLPRRTRERWIAAAACQRLKPSGGDAP